MNEMKWWQTTVIYQIYPRSFADGNGDGIGDFAGIISRLDYLQALGVGTVWLSPHYPSPQVDCGYDVADYMAVAPEYGTLEQFKVFLEAAHRRGIRVILDLVLNHTSDQHPWFIESRSSKNNPKRDCYIWKKGRGNQPPNDWYSTFGGPAWELDPTTGEYYYHYFFKEQPDLNWNNPEVRRTMWKAVRFWLDMGVDGFRLDAVGTIFEEPTWAPHGQPYTLEDLYRIERVAKTAEEKQDALRRWESIFHNQYDQPGVHELMRELRSIIDGYDDRVLIGETDDISYYGHGNDELHMVFNFPLMRVDCLSPGHIMMNQKERLARLPTGGWPCNTLGNHDSRRVYSHFGDGVHDAELARLQLVLLLALKGTPVLYNGEEIGMTDYLIRDLSLFRDPLSTWGYQLEMKVMGTPTEDAILYGAERGRDKCRTPLQWAHSVNGGFCPAGVTPWLPVNPNYAEGVNVADQDKDPLSLLNFYRQVIKLRQQTPALLCGNYRPLETSTSDVLAFLREAQGQIVLAAFNFSSARREAKLSGMGKSGRVLFSTARQSRAGVAVDSLSLQPFEACLILQD
jgi:alpha-glucosidase